jgi:site-specific DNA-methyltransferase (adenine-specific)
MRHSLMKNYIYFGDNLKILKKMPSESVDLIYIDPPFNTKKIQKRTTMKTFRDKKGDRMGFKGLIYKTIELETRGYEDSFGWDEYIHDFIKPRLVEAYRILKPNGSLYFHIDYREVHYCKVLLDTIFTRDSFLNEIIWAYDYGGKSKNKWPAKHDNILVYVKNPKKYTFNVSEVDRIPYMAPGLVGPEKAKLGKLPTDTWWHTIVPTTSNEKTGYPTQKPLGVIDRIIRVSSNPGDTVLDFFAGSGTTGYSCHKFNRQFILIDNSRQSMEVMANRFKGIKNIKWINFNPKEVKKKK